MLRDNLCEHWNIQLLQNKSDEHKSSCYVFGHKMIYKLVEIQFAYLFVAEGRMIAVCFTRGSIKGRKHLTFILHSSLANTLRNQPLIRVLVRPNIYAQQPDCKILCDAII